MKLNENLKITYKLIKKVIADTNLWAGESPNLHTLVNSVSKLEELYEIQILIYIYTKSKYANLYVINL